MKKLLLSVAVLATVFTSCEKEAEVVKTGTLQFNAQTEIKSVGKKSGNVERGTTPVYISSIDVKTNMNGRKTENHFNIVEDSTAGAASNFIIEDVPLGQNVISAVTNPAEDITLRRMFQTSSVTPPAHWRLNEYMGHLAAVAIDNGYEGFKNYTQGNIPPYAIYTGTAHALLVDDEVANVNIPMDTKYGRSLYSIGAENVYDLAHFNVTIRAKYFDADGNEVYNHQVRIDKGLTATIGMWSDELSTEGAKIVFTMEWRSDDPDNIGLDTVLNTETATINIHAKSDMYTKIILKRSTFVVEETGLTFDFEPIVTGDEDIVIE